MTRLTSQLVMELLDRVSQPAQRVAESLRGITGAVGDANAGQMGMGQRLDAAISRNNQALASARMGMVDAAAGAYILHRALSAPVRVAGEFERGMNRVGALSSAAEDQMAALSHQARELGRTTMFSATEVTAGMGFLAQAGFDADQILGAMPGTLQLAAAGQMDLAQAADITSNVLSGYGFEVDQLSRVNDVLAASFTSANTDLAQLGEAMKYAGPVANAAGVQFEEAAAALSLMGNAGIQGSMAGTSLRGAISRILSPTSAAAEEMEELGLQFTDATGRLQPLNEIVRQLEPYADDAGLMMRLFGQRAGPAMAALVGMGADQLEGLTEELENSGGTAERIANVEMEGFQGRMRALWSAVEGLQLSIGNALLPGLTHLANVLTDVLGPITALAERFPEVTATVVSATAAVIGFKVALAALRYIGLLGKGGVLSLLALGFNTLGVAAIGAHMAAKESIRLQTALAGMQGRPLGALDRLRAGLGGIIIAVPGLGKVGAALRALGLIGLGKLGVAIGVVAAGGLLIRKHWERLGNFFSGFADRLRERFGPELDALSERLSMLTPIFNDIAAAWRADVERVSAVWDYLTSIFEREILDDDDRQRIAGAGAEWADMLIGGIEAAVELRQRGLIATMADIGVSIGESLWEAAEPYVTAADDFSARIIERVSSAISRGEAALFETGQRLIQSLWDGMMRRFAAFIETVRAIPGQIIAAIGTIDLSGAVRFPQIPGYGGRSAPSDISPEDQSWLDRAAAAGWQELPARARGGRVSRGGQYQIGERGWELFSPTRSGYIFPHHDALAAMTRPMDLLAGLMGHGAGRGDGSSIELLAPVGARHSGASAPAQISQTFSIALQIEGSGEPRDVSRLVARVRTEIEREMRDAMRAVYADTGVRTY